MNKFKYIVKQTVLIRAYLLVKSRNRRRSFKKKFPESRAIQIKAKIVWLLYGLHANDFYRLCCEKRPWSEIKKMVGYYTCSNLYSAVNGNLWKILNDKWLSYTHFAEYYKRDMIFLSAADMLSGNAMEKIREFMERGHPVVVVKPNRSNQGKGISVCDNVEKVYKYCLRVINEGGVIEALIIQDEELAEFNPSSVNTLRINTVNYGDGEVEVIWPCLRMGREGSFVDNAGAGGIFGAVDVETGTIIGAADEHQHSFTEHPDSHKRLIGYVIPRWQEACELAKKVSQKIPDASFVGWDLALTDVGWVIVEGNYGPLIIWQIAIGEGISQKFHEVEKRLVFKKI